MSAQRFSGKAAIVTGGSSGIGAETCRRLVAEGAAVLLTGRSQERGEQLVEELGAAARFFAVDQTEPDSGARIVRRAIAVCGRVDVLVNCAALDHTGDLLDTPLQEVRELFEVNVFAALTALQAAGRAMRAVGGGGAIVNVTSRLASIGVPTMALYSASKGALLALTRAAAVELAPHRIRVNAVAPGMTRTPLIAAWIAAQEDPAATERDATAAIPQGRFATPAEVAAAIAYLASDEAAHVTGASLAVDGGYTAT
jgi:NAD(P)-dependent dehydrogenase (short-subunit alcohol dehydrogenase family)